MTLTDKAFLEQFENKTLAPVEFKHIGHLRIAWLYLKQADLVTAISKTCNGINQYAISLGITDKFHHTITEFIVRLMSQRVELQPELRFEQFIEKNADLVSDAYGIICQHYSQSLLNSDEAKITYCNPDLLSLDHHPINKDETECIA